MACNRHPTNGGADNSPEQDRLRKGPQHQAEADQFSRLMAKDLTTATISPEAESLLAAEEVGAKVEWEPLDPRIAAYMHNTFKG